MANTQVLQAENRADVQQAIALLGAGELVAVPTETVYGLAADARNVDAIKKIFIAKGRPSSHPLILHIDSAEKLAEWAQDIPPMAHALAHYFWPGPLTMILKKKSTVSPVITGGLSTVAVRVPDHPVLRSIMTSLNTGLVAPSANPHTKLSPTCAEHVMANLGGKIAAVLDGGPCAVGVESIIVDLTGEQPVILRKGPITQAIIEKVLSCSVVAPDQHTTPVSGNMLKHYQPYTPSVLMETPALRAHADTLQACQERVGYMYYSDVPMLLQYDTAIKVPGDSKGYRQVLYDTLHQLDQLGVQKIIIEAPPRTQEWGDVWDRLSRATAIGD